jgi:hypothetical protein
VAVDVALLQVASWFPFPSLSEGDQLIQPDNTKETTMDTKTAFHEIKQLLKSYAVIQRKAKRARKTTIPAVEREALLKEIGSSYPNVMSRRIEITAALNFYHELRGSEFRHGIRKGTEYEYKDRLNSLRAKYSIAVK